MIVNKFNLIDEPWIPIVNGGRVSLKELFGNPNHSALGGNAVQKIALTKLLLAIAQAAYTPTDTEDWMSLGIDRMAEKCLNYLEKWQDRFWLYGANPFLQMPIIFDLIAKRKEQKLKPDTKNAKRLEIEREAQPKSIGSGLYPDVPSANNTVFTQSQFPCPLVDAEKAVFLVTLMNFALGGKRVEKNLGALTANYSGKTDSAKSGPSLGNYVGYTHTLLLGENVLKTIWFNLLTKIDIDDNKTWKSLLGIPPWERMPTGEDCDVAKALKSSYMGCLVAMSRFVLFQEDGIYYVEGIQYPAHKKGWCEPSMTINHHAKDGIKVLWIDSNKRPWRFLTSLLAFISATDQKGYDCPQVRYGLDRIKRSNSEVLHVWSGGLRVRGNAGDQSIKQDDDFVESMISLEIKDVNETWYCQLKSEMSELDRLSKVLYVKINGYFKSQNMEGKNQAIIASNLFWQLCEREFQVLVSVCNDLDKVKSMRKVFFGFVRKVYDALCPKETARQLDAWAKNKPMFDTYNITIKK